MLENAQTNTNPIRIITNSQYNFVSEGINVVGTGSGVKFDEGKNRIGLVVSGFAKALEEVSKVGTFGANKYTDNGWVTVENGFNRYTDAMFRHLFKEFSGEEKDDESGLLHAAHAAWNSLARLQLILNSK